VVTGLPDIKGHLKNKRCRKQSYQKAFGSWSSRSSVVRSVARQLRQLRDWGEGKERGNCCCFCCDFNANKEG